MRKINSTGISSGKAMAVLATIKSTATFAADEKFTTADNEQRRFKEAQKQAIAELYGLALKMKKEKGGEDIAALFETHALMAEDPDFEDAVTEAIAQSNLPAAAAVLQAGEKLGLFFESTDDEYMSKRSADVKDVASRIATIIRKDGSTLPSFSSPVILAADDLTPSQTVLLDKKYVAGFILYNGARDGHTGILARNFGIPAVIRPDENVSDYDGKTVFIDGDTGEIVVDPDRKTAEDLNARIENDRAARYELQKYKDAPTKTSDGRSMKIFCNIGSPDDAYDVIKNGGEGVGLFRSEFLYLGRNDLPSEEEQFESYVKTLKALPGKEVIIRTCDLGADKQAENLSVPAEPNPALGTRAIRLCLERKDMFKAQLRALCRASAFGRLSVMFPMIASVWELEEAKAAVRTVQDELRSKKVPYDPEMKIGIMIETPAAAIISDELAKQADFFSIGSNDLAQYTLACDRGGKLDRYYDPKHPAVLRLIEITAKNARDAGIPVGICGELAADEELAEFFADIGIDELSVSPNTVTSLRKKINSL